MGIKEVYKRLEDTYKQASRDVYRLMGEFKKTGDSIPSITATYFKNGIEEALHIIEEECPEVKSVENQTQFKCNQNAIQAYDELNHEFAMNFVERREYSKGVQFAMNVLVNRFPQCCKHHMVGLDEEKEVEE